MAGPELILGIVALKGNAEVGLSQEQEAALMKILARMVGPQVALQKAADAALSYLTPVQVEWMRRNRGPASVPEAQDVEPGMDPVTATAYRLLQKKAGSAKGEAKVHQHESGDLHFHDLLNGILKMEEAGPEYAVTAEQAKALAAQVEEGNRSRKEENDLFEALYQELNQEQVDYLLEHPELVRMDVNALILRHAQVMLAEP